VAVLMAGATASVWAQEAAAPAAGLVLDDATAAAAAKDKQILAHELSSTWCMSSGFVGVVLWLSSGRLFGGRVRSDR
jgi:hypothetical protein